MWQLRAPSAAPAPSNQTEIGGSRPQAMGELSSARVAQASNRTDRGQSSNLHGSSLAGWMGWHGRRIAASSQAVVVLLRQTPFSELIQKLTAASLSRTRFRYRGSVDHVVPQVVRGAVPVECVCARALQLSTCTNPPPSALTWTTGGTVRRARLWPAIFFTFFFGVFLLVVMIRRPDLSWSL